MKEVRWHGSSRSDVEAFPADARREAMAVLDETAPSNRADWIVKDVPLAKAILDQTKGHP